MRPFVTTCAILIFGLLCRAQQVASAGRWREDIDFLVSALSASGTSVDFSRGIASRGQKDFARLYPPARFRPAVTELKDNVSALSDAEIVLRLMELIAGAHVAHNTVQTPRNFGFERHLPISFGWFSDGMAVIGATPLYSEAVGLEVKSIGSETPAQLIKAVGQFLSHENPARLFVIAPEFLELQPVLSHLGVIDPDGSVRLTLGSAVRKSIVLKLSFTTSNEARTGLWKALNIPRPLFWMQPGKKYLSRYLDDSRTVYIQYNECAEESGESFSSFTRDVMREIDTHTVERVLIDLRWNGGGDSRVISPLKKALASRSEVAGHVYVAIGQNTFSSAIQNAIELRREVGAILVGESTGGSPNGYGEVKTITLPNSKLVVRYTSRYYASLDGKDVLSLSPDIPAPLTLHDVVLSRDPALTAILAK
jgi:hypothetical protein